MKANDFHAAFKSGEEITEYLDLLAAKRPKQNIKRVNVDFPIWMV